MSNSASLQTISRILLSAAIVLFLVNCESQPDAVDGRMRDSVNRSSAEDTRADGEESSADQDPTQSELSSQRRQNSTEYAVLQERHQGRAAEESRSLAYTGSRILGTGSLDRDDKKESPGQWYKTDLQFNLLDVEPSGDSMTVIPSDPGSPAVTVSANSYRKRMVCDQEFWDMEQIQIDRKVYRDVRPEQERPFEFLVIQPPLHYFAHTDSLGDIAVARENSRFYRNTVVFAVDYTGDGVADLAQTRYCCGDPSVYRGEGPSDCRRCSAAYHRDTEGKWVQTFKTAPC